MLVTIEKLNGSNSVNTKVTESFADAMIWTARRIKEVEAEVGAEDISFAYDSENQEVCVTYDPDGDWMDYRWRIVEML